MSVKINVKVYHVTVAHSLLAESQRAHLSGSSIHRNEDARG